MSRLQYSEVQPYMTLPGSSTLTWKEGYCNTQGSCPSPNPIQQDNNLNGEKGSLLVKIPSDKWLERRANTLVDRIQHKESKQNRNKVPHSCPQN